MSAISEIESIVTFYNGITKDFQDIERLQSGVRKLATLLFMFAGELGLLYKEKNDTEFSKQAAIERKKVLSGSIKKKLTNEYKSIMYARRAIYAKCNIQKSKIINLVF